MSFCAFARFLCMSKTQKSPHLLPPTPYHLSPATPLKTPPSSAIIEHTCYYGSRHLLLFRPPQHLQSLPQLAYPRLPARRRGHTPGRRAGQRQILPRARSRHPPRHRPPCLANLIPTAPARGLLLPGFHPLPLRAPPSSPHFHPHSR